MKSIYILIVLLSAACFESISESWEISCSVKSCLKIFVCFPVSLGVMFLFEFANRLMMDELSEKGYHRRLRIFKQVAVSIVISVIFCYLASSLLFLSFDINQWLLKCEKLDTFGFLLSFMLIVFCVTSVVGSFLFGHFEDER